MVSKNYNDLNVLKNRFQSDKLKDDKMICKKNSKLL